MKRSSKSRFNRPSWDRMVRIHEWIREGRFPNSPWMAKELGVSVRTIKRDVEFLMDRWHLPIAYDERRYGMARLVSAGKADVKPFTIHRNGRLCCIPHYRIPALDRFHQGDDPESNPGPFDC